jgi:amino acid transporter
MSEAANVPFTETKAPESPERLHRGALRLVDISASTMANIGPAYSFYFSAAVIVGTAGIGAPLTVLTAAVAIALLGNTLSQFSRAHPSAGGFITFVGKTFGGTSAVTTALLVGAGYIIAIASVLVISGGFLSIILQYYFGWNVPWVVFSVLLTGGAMVMMFRGVGVSTKLAGLFFGFELLILVVVSIATIIKNGPHLSATPFEPHYVTNGFRGLADGFPLAVYLFIGWENSAALAEETDNPRRNVPRAVYLSTLLMAVTYLLLTYATVTGFHYSESALTNPAIAIPFINVAHGVVGWLAFFAFIAGLTSTIGVLIAAVNSQCRLIFNAGREGLLPRWIGKVNQTRLTPVNAIIAFVGIATVITLGWAIGHWIGGSHSGPLSALNFYADSATMGTILILVVYFLANLALPFYYRKYRPGEFSLVKHAILPVIGMIAIAIPIYYLCKPPQPQPENWFPWAALGIAVVSILYSIWLVKRDPGLGDRVGSIVADE